MQISVQADQLADRRTGDESHLMQVHSQPATAVMIDQLIQFDAKLFDVVFFT